MADTLKGVNHDLTTSLGDSALTAGGSEIITIIGLQVANVHATDAATLDVYIDRASGDDGYVVKGISIPINDTLSVIQGKIVLGAGDAIQMKADATSKLEATVSYLSQT
tara:strand:- start:237 stop:563 length:327 start_codon:yes stop_codon:yes gene_type:complete